MADISSDRVCIHLQFGSFVVDIADSFSREHSQGTMLYSTRRMYVCVYNIDENVLNTYTYVDTYVYMHINIHILCYMGKHMCIYIYTHIDISLYICLSCIDSRKSIELNFGQVHFLSFNEKQFLGLTQKSQKCGPPKRCKLVYKPQ